MKILGITLVVIVILATILVILIHIGDNKRKESQKSIDNR